MSLNNFIQLTHGINPDFLKEVDVVPMTVEQLAVAKDIVQPQQCFDNCFELAASLNATYVLGVYCGLIPIEHAFIKVGDKYYDPTLEIVTGNLEGQYFSFLEIPLSELVEFITKVQEVNRSEHAYPPMLQDVRNHPDCNDMFISMRDMRSLFSNGEIVLN